MMTCAHPESFEDGIDRWCPDCGSVLEHYVKGWGWVPGPSGQNDRWSIDGYVED